MAEEKYKIWWDKENEIIRIKVSGVQTEKSAEDFCKELLDLVNSLKKDGVEKIYGMSDSTEAGTSIDIKARRIYANLMKEEFFKDSRVAIFGIGGPQKMVMNFLIGFSGLKNVKFFKTEADALEWLKKEKNR